MAFYDDLTPHTYFHSEERPETVNIGWLARRHIFSTVETSVEFRFKLQELCEKSRVKQTRGRHNCEFCKGRDKPFGSAEIRVIGHKRIYAAPELVYHYVVVHDYKPPDEFIAAMLASRKKRP